MSVSSSVNTVAPSANSSGALSSAIREPSTLWPDSVPGAVWLRSMSIRCATVRMRSFESSSKVVLPSPIAIPSGAMSPAFTV